MSNYAGVIDGITSLKSDICDAIREASTTLSSTPESGFLEGFADTALAAVLGAFSAYIFNRIHWNMVEKKRKSSIKCGELVATINDMEQKSIQYWVQGYSEENAQEISALEVVLKTKPRLLKGFAREFVASLKNDKARRIKGSLDFFQREIFDIATGGDFESKKREASKARAIKISRLCSEIKAKVAALDV